MRVLFLTNVPSPYRVEFFNELSEKCELTVAFEMPDAGNRNENWKSKEQFRFRAVFLKPLLRKVDGAFCPEITRLLKKFKKDLIVIGGYSTPTGMYAIEYMRLHHIPFILNCDGGMVKNDNYIKGVIKRHFIGAASFYLCAGEISKEYLVHYGADLKRIYSYPFSSVKKADIGAPLGNGERRELREKLKIKEKNMILYVGSFIHRKGVDVLIRAVKELEDTALVLVGGDDIKTYDELLSGGMKCTVYAPGFFNKDGLKDYYMAADLFVLPTREDIWGLVVNEALGYGLPVVTTDKCNAGLELVKAGNNGYIVKADDVEELNRAICSFLRLSETEKESFRNNAFATMDDYTIESMTEAHVKILNEIGRINGK